ncbi:MAG: hypothetical protein HY060_06280 [Proteobacteria bacterium]|nr:hypothetical protein [Pseudomonadota bacterium]
MDTEPDDAETLIGRTSDGDTVLVARAHALLLTPAGVRALIRGLALSQHLTVRVAAAPARLRRARR